MTLQIDLPDDNARKMESRLDVVIGKAWNGQAGGILITCNEMWLFWTLSPPDPFADATKGDDRLPAGTDDYIHIRIQQRNGRKTLTTVQGIAPDYDKKKLVKAFKKVLYCFEMLFFFIHF